MARMKLISIPVAAAAIAFAVAGCGGGSSSSNSSTTAKQPSSATKTTSSGATVDVRKSDLGTMLTDSSGRTLYLFEKDKGDSSTCNGSCASAWPPLTTTGTPKAGAGVKASALGTTKRQDGTSEVTYNGHPLYYYVGDSGAGMTNGQGLDQFGAEWYVLAPSGNKIDKS
jgi:predicted lipoprotein with Yx(FWY)xxD motif